MHRCGFPSLPLYTAQERQREGALFHSTAGLSYTGRPVGAGVQPTTTASNANGNPPRKPPRNLQQMGAFVLAEHRNTTTERAPPLPRDLKSTRAGSSTWPVLGHPPHQYWPPGATKRTLACLERLTLPRQRLEVPQEQQARHTRHSPFDPRLQVSLSLEPCLPQHVETVQLHQPCRQLLQSRSERRKKERKASSPGGGGTERHC